MTARGGAEQTIRIPNIDTCAQEQIHLLGHVQDYGCLISTSVDFMVTHVSQNLKSVLGLDPEDVIGLPLKDHLPSQTLHDLRTKLQVLSSGAEAARLFRYDVMADGRIFDISVHVSGQTFVFEFEPKVDDIERDEMAMVQPLLGRVKASDSVSAACQEAARALKALSGFDRVMVYRFAPDGSGEVIAETAAAGMESYLGLRYPASDIPPQARALYMRSMLRLISDVNGPVSAIVPEMSASGQPLDLSLSVTRAVSPIHLEYLRNMGVEASMSVSIIKDGALWGLFACHNRSPHYVDYERRTAIELFAQFFTYELAQKSQDEARVKDEEARQMHDQLMIQLSGGTSLLDGFDGIATALFELVPSDGICIYSEGRYASIGVAPDEAEFAHLVRFLNTTQQGTIYATDHLASVYAGAEGLADRVAGVMAVPISRTPRDYIVFFRREIANFVRWAGNPEKAVEQAEDGLRLSPRKSFAAWNEVVKNTSAPWSEATLRIAENLRVSLIEVVLKLTDEANIERRKAADKQELLIAELNHRVRNILNLIQGLVSQSKGKAHNVESYTQVLDGRIQALARAHDQLTDQNWGPTALRHLIEVEASAFLAGQKERLQITGDSPMLEPEAFSTMALVVHELVTNCAKYGAMTDHSGVVSVDLKVQPDGALVIAWREKGGPPVKAPTRRGFGTTIIEKTIPFELKGTVDVRYLLSGFEADLMIPDKFVAGFEAQRPAEPTLVEAEASPVAAVALSPNEVLVLEDNMIIAMEASDILTNAGSKNVHMASSVDDALALLGQYPIGFALLDVNLGDQTSLPVAEQLAKDGVPFVLATGYGDAQDITRSFPACEVIKKPYTSETLLAAVARAQNAD